MTQQELSRDEDRADQSMAPAAIASTPKEGQLVAHDRKEFTTIREGLAYILVPKDAPTLLDTKQHQKAQKEGRQLPGQSVFYNPIQQFNRDLSVLAIKVYSEHVAASFERKANRAKERRTRKQGEKPRQEAKAAAPEPKTDASRRDENGEQLPSGVKRKAGEMLSQEASEGDQSAKRHKADDHDDGKSDSRTPTVNGTSENIPVEADTSAPTNDSVNTAHSKEDSSGFKRSESRPPRQFKILDALSATGLRALRYAREVPEATSITANDLSSDATRSIDLNVQHNKLSDRIKVTTENALSHMYQFVGKEGDGKYDVIDLDPYGTAAPFLDAAVQALNNDGLLCVTCTDAGVWASHGYSEKTFSLYGGNPIKGRHSHEGGLRLILHAIATSAARYGIAIEPLLSLSIDFYARLFVRVRKSPEQVKFLAGKTMLVYSCDSGCGSYKTQLIGRNDTTKNKVGGTIYKHGMAQGPSCGPYCDQCGFKTHLSGPMWAGPLHNPRFLARLLATLPRGVDTYGTIERIEGMVSTALEETLVEEYPERQTLEAEPDADERIIEPLHPAAADLHPFFFILPALAGVIHCSAPGELPIKGALRHAGYKAVRSHTQPSSIKTDAPWAFIWKMMRAWVKQRAPIKEGALKPGTAGYQIMFAEDADAAIANGNSNDKSVGSKDIPPQGSDDEVTESTNGNERKANSIVFDEELGKERQKRRLVRYQMNPRENWGPMNRAKR